MSAPLSRTISAWNAEIMLRRKEIEKEVRAGRMRESQREFIIASLEAGVDQLKWLEANESLIKQRLFNGDLPPAESPRPETPKLETASA